MTVNDFISEYVSVISDEMGRDHNLRTLEAAAMMLISSVVGKKVFNPTTPDQNIWSLDNPNLSATARAGDYYNIWVIVTAPSRLGRKTSVARAMRDYLNINNSDLLIPDMNTPEALVDMMADSANIHEYSRGVWINDEVTTFFKLVQAGGYNSSADTIMSKLYDGDNYTRNTKKGGKVTVISPHFNMWIATTEALADFITPTMIKQGFLNRPIYVSDAIRQPGKPKPRGNVSQQAKDKMNELREWLNSWVSIDTHGCTIGMTKAAKNTLRIYEERIENNLLNLSGEAKRLEDYYGNLPNMVEKVAGIFRISRIPTLGLIPTAQGNIRGWITIDRSDVNRAIKLCTQSIRDYSSIVSLMYENKTPVTLKTDPMNALILREVKKHEKISRNNLIRAMDPGIKVDANYINAINTLLSRGDIKSWQYKAKPMNKTSTTFFVHKKSKFRPPSVAKEVKHISF